MLGPGLRVDEFQTTGIQVFYSPESEAQVHEGPNILRSSQEPAVEGVVFKRAWELFRSLLGPGSHCVGVTFSPGELNQRFREFVLIYGMVFHNFNKSPWEVKISDD